jgi:hypothetical protein
LTWVPPTSMTSTSMDRPIVVAPRRLLVALSAGHSFDAFDRGSRSGRSAVGFSIQDFAPAGARRSRLLWGANAQRIAGKPLDERDFLQTTAKN